MEQVYFFEKYPFMGVELLKLIKNITLVCYNQDGVFESLSKEGFSLFSYKNTDFITPIDSDQAVLKIISDKKFVLDKEIEKNNSGWLFFYMNKKIAEAVNNHKVRLLLPPYKIQEKIGNKLFVSNICKNLGLTQNKSLSFKDRKDIFVQFDECVSKLGLPFVIQGSFGVSGDDTYLIDNKDKFFKTIEKIDSGIKAAKYLRDVVPISVHLCITEEKTYIEGPFLQIIGFDTLTKNQFQFSGNDTNQSLFTPTMLNRVRKTSEKIAGDMKKRGYLGIAGIDYLWERETDEIYLQEINSRLVGLTRLLTGIQKEQGIVPDLVRHIKIFEPKVVFDASLKDFSPVDVLHHHYSQIYISNNSKKEVLIKRYLEPGGYKIVDLKLEKISDSLFFEDINEGELIITYSAYEGAIIKKNSLITRMLLKKSVIKDGAYCLNDEIKTIVDFVRSYTI